MKTVNLILNNFKHVRELSWYNNNFYTDSSKTILEECDELHNTLSYYWVNGDIKEYIGYTQNDLSPAIDGAPEIGLELITDYLT